MNVLFKYLNCKCDFLYYDVMIRKYETLIQTDHKIITIWQNTEKDQTVLKIRLIKNFVIIKFYNTRKNTFVFNDKKISSTISLNELYCLIKQEYKDVSSETQFKDEKIITTNMTFREVNEFILNIIDDSI
jgi:hypothetical protein